MASMASPEARPSPSAVVEDTDADSDLYVDMRKERHCKPNVLDHDIT